MPIDIHRTHLANLFAEIRFTDQEESDPSAMLKRAKSFLFRLSRLGVKDLPTPENLVSDLRFIREQEAAGG